MDLLGGTWRQFKRSESTSFRILLPLQMVGESQYATEGKTDIFVWQVVTTDDDRNQNVKAGDFL
tara:strand:+ start:212 stop:403 length:192 start_codon:yes stop_codon:yes gene_type:complete